MARVAILGTFDTKGEELAFLSEKVRSAGASTPLVDVGVRARGVEKVDIVSRQVAEAGGGDLDALRASNDRNQAIAVMARGAAAILGDLSAKGLIQGAIALGGGGGTSLAAEAFTPLAIGFPKMIVSTIAAGDVRSIVRGRDVTLMYSVLDISGLNPISRRIIGNAAYAIAGMADAQGQEPETEDEPLVAITAFGVTTDAVNVARERFEEKGYTVLVFHATGEGGRSLEELIRSGLIKGVLDLTTTELADDLVGGVMSAGPSRLTAAAEMGIPQVVSVGALDMVNLGPPDSIKEEFRGRNLLNHNFAMVLMRTSVDECRKLGATIAAKLNKSKGPTTVMIPRKGVSSVSVEGRPFYDSEADSALFASIRANIAAHVSLVERDLAINDGAFAREAADILMKYLEHP